MSIAIDQPVPADLRVPATGDQTLGPADFQGRIVVLYFYPKDNTPGCTNESRDFAANLDAFQGAGAVILGVSRDSVKSHENFRTKQELPFDLLSDGDETLCNAFDVIKMKNMYGKQVRGIERSTFLIDADGVLRKEWRKVKVPGHVDEVLAAVRELAGS
ncbi:MULTISPECIES: peroxiredoxin [unclassified Thioalkalivibrio]|uniref:peroxiredoxin n=1 Tax=unclassified Thioalkalivibrio TaxID=2621013 RepID=UPI000370532F|nr:MULTISPECIES: peroxiredoxin [unclassified Thioalkalivibrio]